MTCNRQRLLEATVQIAELGEACSEHVKARCCEDALTARQASPSSAICTVASISLCLLQVIKHSIN